MQKAMIETEFGYIFVERDASLPQYKNVSIRHVGSNILLSTNEAVAVARYLLDFARLERGIDPYSVPCASRTLLGGTVVDMDHPCPYPAVVSSTAEFGFSS